MYVGGRGVWIVNLCMCPLTVAQGQLGKPLVITTLLYFIEKKKHSSSKAHPEGHVTLESKSDKK